MRSRKGQAAMEFLMTYGWAILVVLAAIGALAYFGILSPDNFLPKKCTVSGGFSCVDYKVTNTTVTLHLQNNLGFDADTVNVTLTTNDCTLNTSTVAAGAVDNGEPVSGTGGVSFTCDDGVSSRFKGDITITYIGSGKYESHQATGSITAAVEE